ncbi:hypothetical protein SUDANB15_04623 [Streptomyces sp. enrichment culture]
MAGGRTGPEDAGNAGLHPCREAGTTDGQPSTTTVTPRIRDTVERYFALLQAHASPERVLDDVLTPDFRTGFAGGHVWRGPEGPADFLRARSELFDESHEIRRMSEPVAPADGLWAVRTRLGLALRRRAPAAPRSELLTGVASHAWELRAGPRWRVAARMVEGFAHLDEGARTLFGTPGTGLNT